MDAPVALAALVVFLAVLVLAVMVGYRSRGAGEVRSLVKDIAVLQEKLTHLESIIPAVGGVQADLRGLAARVTQVEQHQIQMSQGIAGLQAGLVQAGTVARSLTDAAEAIRRELVHARTDLAALQAEARARQEHEQQMAAAIGRLESIIAGTHTKGAAGENILEAVLAQLPPEWQVRNFRVGNRVVEFGLRLPNNLILPIDSKWPATALLDQFAGCNDQQEKQRLKSQIEAVVLDRAREVQKYIEPDLTVNFAVAVVPDAVFELCAGVHAHAFRLNVVLISYSMLVPYLLLVFQTTLRASRNIDLAKLDACLQTAQETIRALQDELETRVQRALTMLTNARDDMSRQLSKLGAGLQGLRDAAEAVAQTGAPEKALPDAPLTPE